MKKIQFFNKNCKNCLLFFNRKNKEKAINFRKRQFCSRKCYLIWAIGENHHRWKKYRFSSGGYLIDGQTKKFLHRIVMEKYLGRALTNFEFVHHIDGNKLNNSISNLELLDAKLHGKKHVMFKRRDSHGRFEPSKILERYLENLATC